MRHKGKKLVAILTAVSLLMPGATTFADEVLEDGFETEVAFQDESGAEEDSVEDGFDEQQEVVEEDEVTEFSTDDIYSADDIYPDELGEIDFIGEDISYYSDEDVVSSDVLNEELFVTDEVATDEAAGEDQNAITEEMVLSPDSVIDETEAVSEEDSLSLIDENGTPVSEDVQVASNAEWKYAYNNLGAALTAYIGSSTEIVIPATVDGKKVIGVKSGLLYDHRDTIKSVVIEAELTSLPDSFFSGFSKLESVTLPDCMTDMGTGIFNYCDALTQVHLPSALKSIKGNAFYDCDSLENIAIPDSVEEIGYEAFYRCISLKKVILSDGLKRIGASSFVNCKALETLIFPQRLELIGDSAFSGCSSLKAVDLPDGIITTYDSWGNVNSYGIGRYAFYGCSSVKSVKLPSQMQALNTGVFNGCTSLSDIILPETMKSIGYEVFSNCDSLKEIKLPETLTTIGSYAFSGCDALTRVKLPASLTSIGESAFQDCFILTNLSIYNKVTSIGSNAFKGDPFLILSCIDNEYAVNYAKSNNLLYATVEVEQQGKTVTATMTAETLSQVPDGKEWETEVNEVSLKFDSEAVKTIKENSGSSDITLKMAEVEEGNTGNAVKDEIINRFVENDGKVLDLSLKDSEDQPVAFSDGNAGSFTLTVPYKAPQGTTPQVFYIADNGGIEDIPSSYDKKEELVSFTTTHFSVFAIGSAALADSGDRSYGSLRVTMDLKSKDGGEICVQGEPHLFIYLKQTMTSEGKVPETPQEYTIRLRNCSKGSGEFWTVSNRIGSPVAGTYTVQYYTPFAESEVDCDKKVPSYVESAPDTSLMYEILPGEKFAGSTMKLSSDAAKNLLISKTEDSKLELSAEATTRATIIPGAYKKITGTKSTKAGFVFNLFSSNSDGEEGEHLMTASTNGAQITQELGYGLYFNPVSLPAPGDYWFLIREDNSSATFFTPEADSVYCHATVGYSDSGVLNITALEYLQGSVKETSTSRKLTVSSSLDELTVKGNNKDVSGDTVYELYGPFEGHSPKRDDQGTYGKPTQTKKGSSYTFSNIELFRDWYTYVIVERESKDGPENRDHLVMITGRWTSDGAQWYIKDRASFTNKYSVESVQQTFTINNEIKGKPTTAQTFTYRMRRVSDNQIATIKINANATKTKDVKLPSFSKSGTYDFRITETAGSAAGFSYNLESKTYRLKYVVKDNGKGKLNVTTYVDDQKVKDEKPVLTFKNKYAVKVRIQHVDATTSKGVSGGKSRIVNKNGEEVKKTWKSDGTAKEVAVTADGTYTIKEVKAPTGYQVADDAYFKIKDGKVTYNKQSTTTIKIPHTKITGSFTFKKVSSANTKTTISNVEFYLYKIAYEKGTKNYESAAANLKKGKIKWSQLKAYKRAVSQTDGVVTFTTLEPDTYYVIKENSVGGNPYKLTPESKSAVISTKYSEKSKKVTTKVVSGNNVLVHSSGSFIWKDDPLDKSVSIKSIKASGNEITITWKKTTEKVTGYQISYSTTKDFSSGVKTVNVADRNSTSATIKNLKNKTRYYVRMRTYKKTSGTDYDYYTYGAWSDVKNVKTE